MKKEIFINNIQEIIDLGKRIGEFSFPNMVITMNGNLGAGKTTITKGIGKAMGIKRVINSPTFTIMKIYEGTLNLYHLDVYRIENSESDFELEEYFYMGGVSVIEWSNNIKELIPEDAISLEFEIMEDASRLVTIVGPSEFIEKLETGE